MFQNWPCSDSKALLVINFWIQPVQDSLHCSCIGVAASGAELIEAQYISRHTAPHAHDCICLLGTYARARNSLQAACCHQSNLLVIAVDGLCVVQAF